MRAALVLAALPVLALAGAAVAQEQPPEDELRPLQQEVAALRADVGRTNARLRSMFGDDTFGVARITIAQESHMSRTYRLERAQYALDGHVVFLGTDEQGTLAGRAQLDVYAGALTSGPHVLSLSLTWRLHGWGIFEYLNAYTFTMRSSTVLVVPSTGEVRVRAILFERGSPLGTFEERPTVQYRTETEGRGAR